jgi:hypothetical protein
MLKKCFVSQLKPFKVAHWLLTFLLISTMIQQQVMAKGRPDVRAALPAKSDLPEFDKYQFLSIGKGKLVSAVRKTDKLSFDVEAMAANTQEEAKKDIKEALNWHSVAMLKGSPTGKKIGEECWHTYRSDSDTVEIIARDGRATVSVRMSLPVAKDAQGKIIRKNGNPVRGKLSQGDLRFAEEQAIKALGKLKALGLTSGK